MPAFHSYAMIQTFLLTLHPSDPKPQAIPRNHMTSQSFEIPQGTLPVQRRHWKGSGGHPWSCWKPRRVPGDKPGRPRKCLTHKIDVLQVAALPCFVRDDAARKSLTQSRNSQVDILKLAGRRPAMIRTHCEPVETMSDIIALGNTTHLAFWTIEWLRRVSESHVFIDVYGMFIRICLSPPFFVLFGRPKRKHMCSSLLEIDLLKTLYFSAE